MTQIKVTSQVLMTRSDIANLPLGISQLFPPQENVAQWKIKAPKESPCPFILCEKGTEDKITWKLIRPLDKGQMGRVLRLLHRKGRLNVKEEEHSNA